MMEKQEFFDYVKENVGRYLPVEYKNATVSLVPVVKNNDRKLTGLTIVKEGENISPSIYLNESYERYCLGTALEDIVRETAEQRVTLDEIQIPDMAISSSQITNYEAVREHLAIHICDVEANRERLGQLVHLQEGDFAMTYHINVAEKGEDASMSIAVMPSLLDAWGISREQLHADAMAAEMKRGPELMSMDDLFDSMMHMEYRNLLTSAEPISLSEEMEKSPLFILSNREKNFGAGYIMNPQIREKIGEVLGADYYVLPSSVHEVLILPADERSDVPMLSEMVSEINRTQIDSDIRLSDHVQYYDRDSRVLENAVRRQERIEREKETGRKPESRSVLDKLAEKKEESMAVLKDALPKPGRKLEPAL